MKQIIWSSEDRLDDNARERYQEFQREVQDDNTYIVSDEEWADEVYGYLDDERHNLNKHIDGVIMVFADLWPEARLPNTGQQYRRHIALPM